MPFIGSGQFQRVVGPYQGATLWQDQSIAEQAGGVLGPINPAYFDVQDQDFANGLSNCFTRDGQSTPTADLPMDGKKFTNVGNATAGNQFAVVSQLQSGVYTYGGIATGTANAIVISVFPAITAYSAGMSIRFKAASTNTTGGVTVNLNGLGAVALRSAEAAGDHLFAAEIVAGQIYDIMHNGTIWLLANNAGRATQTWTPIFSGSGSMTYTGVTILHARYQRNPGNVCEVWIQTLGTTGGTAGIGINITLPFQAMNVNSVGAASITDGGGNVSAQCLVQSSGLIIRKLDAANWGLGASRGVIAWARYETLLA